jgi:hypothetical protein
MIWGLYDSLWMQWSWLSRVDAGQIEKWLQCRKTERLARGGHVGMVRKKVKYHGVVLFSRLWN